MTKLDDREVYTRSDLVRLHGLALSTLERWYRERASTGHPEAAGTIDGALVWDASAWSRWFAGLESWDQLAARTGRHRRDLQRLWSDRDRNGHPQVRKRVGGTVYFDPAEYTAWIATAEPPAPSTRSVRRDGSPEDLITLSEAARVLGMEPTSITMYPKRPPAGWPEPAEQETLPSGRTRRRYRRADIWAYADQVAHPRGGRPTGATTGRRFPDNGDPRLAIARRALDDTPPDQHATLAASLAAEHGASPGTWSRILTAARRRSNE